MQTLLAEFSKNIPEGLEAREILRSCVHCGFCNATCPTYRLLGDERDGPRGRIYLLKMVLEGREAGPRTRLHLDRCLSCRACETTCPSGVKYGRLADIGRGILETRVPRPAKERLLRLALRTMLPYPRRFGPLLAAARVLRPLLPTGLRAKIPPRRPASTWPSRIHARKMLILKGCVQPALAPGIDAAAARVLDRLGIGLMPAEGGCCGALSYHLAAQEEGKVFMRRNIDAWWPHIERGAEAIVMTASGCGALVKEYGEILRHDPRYAEKAARVAALAKDLGEVLAEKNLESIGPATPRKIAFHAPCTLQHAQKLNGVVEALLKGLGFELTPVADPHLCCGSAGTYSLLQPQLSEELLRAKLEALEAGQPEIIATANIGCLAYLQGKARVPVRHWIELLLDSNDPIPCSKPRLSGY